MALSTAKKSALLQLCNCISSTFSICNLKDLSDGKFFVNTISFVFPEFLKDTEENEAINHAEYVDSPKPLETNVLEVDTTEQASVKNIVKSVDKDGLPGDKNVLQRFIFVQKFIDERYDLKSEEIISYNQCVESNELELAKVAIFVLSEIVKHYVHIKNDDIQTLSHLDVKVQEDLEECFNYFIAERSKILKNDVERILCNPAKYKAASSPIRNSFATPQRACSSKYRRSLSSTPAEDLFTNSPLKSFFESPIFKKEDIFLKNEELKKVRSALEEERLRCDELRDELKEVKKKLDQKDMKIQELKQNAARRNEVKEEMMSECTNEECKKQFENLQSLFKRQSSFWHTEYTALLHKLQKNPEDESSKDDKKAAIPNVDALVEIKLVEKNAQIDRLTEQVATLQQQLEDTSKDLSAYKLMFEEKRSSVKEEPVTPDFTVLNENIGEIIEEENRKLQAELKEATLQINKLIKENMELKERVQNEKNQLSFINSSDHPSMPKLIDLDDLTEKERSQSVRLSDSVKNCELMEQSPLNSPRTKQPSASTEWEGDPPTENMSEAVLWKQYFSESDVENNLSADCINIENDLSIGRDASVTKCKDVISYSSVQDEETCIQSVPESTIKTDVISVEANSVVEHIIHTIINFFKGLSTNGSYKYEIKDLKKLKMECSSLRTSPNGSNGHDPRVLLIKMFGSLISAIHQEKGTTGAPTQKTVNEINELKSQLAGRSSLLKEKENELSKLKSEYDSLESKYKKIEKEKDEIIKNIEHFEETSKVLKKRCEEVSLKYSDKKKELFQSTNLLNQLKQDYKSLKWEHQRLREKYELKNREVMNFAKKDAQLVSLSSRLTQKENEVTAHKSKNIKLTEKIKELLAAENDLKGRVKNLEMELEKKEKYLSTALETLNNFKRNRGSSHPEIDQSILEPNTSNSLHVPELSVTSRDRSNGSMLSGAFYRKSKTPFLLENQDEEDFLNHSSIDDIKTKSEEERLMELKRRNSILPIHLQSVYPVEANLPLSSGDLYVKNRENASDPTSKKRKLHDTEFGKETSQSFKTPIRIKRYEIKTPGSLKKLLMMKNRKNRPTVVKGKP